MFWKYDQMCRVVNNVLHYRKLVESYDANRGSKWIQRGMSNKYLMCPW